MSALNRHYSAVDSATGINLDVPGVVDVVSEGFFEVGVNAAFMAATEGILGVGEPVGPEGPLPPGWSSDWELGGASSEGGGMHWWDPEGGEWRFHCEDAWHPESHWDYNPWYQWNGPWQNIPLCGLNG